MEGQVEDVRRKRMRSDDSFISIRERHYIHHRSMRTSQGANGYVDCLSRVSPSKEQLGNGEQLQMGVDTFVDRVLSAIAVAHSIDEYIIYAMEGILYMRWRVYYISYRFSRQDPLTAHPHILEKG
jgi:hypothetical protein